MCVHYYCISHLTVFQPPPQVTPRISRIEAQTTMTIDGQQIGIRADDLISIEELGRGAYGVVEKVKCCLLSRVGLCLMKGDCEMAIGTTRQF